MSEINDAATNIYNRLAAAPTFHPAGADLFTDWNLQSGDVVTVKSGDESYNVPIYNMRLHWAGDSKIEVESTGNPEREPLPAIKRREYASGASTYSGMKTLGGGIGNALNQTAEINGVLYAAGLQIDPVTGVWLYASEHGSNYALGSSFKVQSDAITAEVSRATAAEGTMSSRITQTADQIQAEVTARQNGEEVLGSRITQTATMIQTEVTNRQNADNQMASRITQTADAITAEVTRASTAEGNLSSRITVNAEGIETKVSKNGVISAINQTAESITIQASKINLSGYTTASQFQAEQARLTNVITGAQRVTYLDCLQLQSSQSRLETVTVERELVYAGYGDLASKIIKEFGAAIESSGVLTIPSTTLNNSAGPSFSFNITDTATYKAAAVSRVSVSLSGTPGEDSGHYYQSGTATLTKANGTTQNVSVSGIVVDSAVSYGRGLMGVRVSGNVVQRYETSLSSVTITTDASVHYNSNTHKYTALSLAYANGVAMTGTEDTSAPSGTEAYDTGYEEGQGSVTISSVAKNGTTTYSANYKTCYIPVLATASNGKTYSGQVSSDITDSYNAGRDSVTTITSAGVVPSGSITISGGVVTQNATVNVTLGNGKTASRSNVSVNMTDAYDAGWTAGYSAAGTYTLASYAKKGLTGYNTSSKVTLYYYERNTYYSAGTYYWYHAGSNGWDTLYERS